MTNERFQSIGRQYTMRVKDFFNGLIEGKLVLGFAKIAFPLSIQDSALPEGMVFQRAHVVALFLNGTHTGPINADGLRVDYDLVMRNGFRAMGEVRLLGAKIGGNLSCVNGHFSDPNGNALSADGVKVGGTVFLANGFQATGEVRLLGAKIGRDFVCINGHFNNPNGKALNADRVEVGGNVLLKDEFQATGEVCLLGAKIGGNLECDNSHFSNPNGKALNADRVDVKGSVFLRDQFQAEGVVDFSIATVGQSFQWWDVKNPELCTLRLESARIGTLLDAEKSWPKKLYLDGLVYDRLHNKAPVGWKERLEWLERQDYKEPCNNKLLRFLAKRAPSDRVRNAIFALDSYRRTKKKFVPQPYVQLAKVLKEMGHEGDAKNILIEKERARRQFGKLGIRGWVWNWGLDVTIRYGYRTHRALLVLLVLQRHMVMIYPANTRAVLRCGCLLRPVR